MKMISVTCIYLPWSRLHSDLPGQLAALTGICCNNAGSLSPAQRLPGGEQFPGGVPANYSPGERVGKGNRVLTVQRDW